MTTTVHEREAREVLTGGRVRARIVKSHLQWVRDYHGEDALGRLLEMLPERDIATIAPAAWCSFESVVRLDRAIEAMFGRGRPGFLREMGRYSAHLNLTAMQPLLKRDDLHAFFHRAVLLHSQFQDFGTAEYEERWECSGRMVHSGYRCFSPVYCASAVGYYEQAIVLHGVRPVVVLETSCQCAGDAACTFELQWDDALQAG
jgi:hypothetical protein